MRRATAILAAALLMGQAAIAAAQEQTFFGPKSYDHPAGGTHTNALRPVIDRPTTSVLICRVPSNEYSASASAK